MKLTEKPTQLLLWVCLEWRKNPALTNTLYQYIIIYREQNWIQILTPHYTRCVTIGKALNISEPQFLGLQNGRNDALLMGVQ